MRMRGYQPLGAVGDYDTADDDADTYRQKRGPSLVMAIAKTIWKVMAMAAVLKLFQDLLLFVNPQILRCVGAECETHCVDNIVNYMHRQVLYTGPGGICDGLLLPFTGYSSTL